MAVTLVASSVTSAADSDTVTRSANILDGHLVCLVHIYYDSSTATSNMASSGFTELVTGVSTGNIIRARLGYQIAASEPASYTIDNSASNYNELICFGLTGFDSGAPWATGGGAATSNTGNGTTVTWTGLTVPRNDSLGIAVKGGYGGATSANPSTWSVVIADMDGVNDVFSKALNAGSLSSFTATQASDTWVALLAIAQPVDAGGGGAITTRKSLLGVGLNRLRRDEWERRPGSHIYTR